MAGMNQFLAQPALVDRILGLERRRDMLAGRGRGRLGLVDMGLDHQALEKKRQKREDAHPLTSGGGAGNRVSLVRHDGGMKNPRLTIKRSGTVPQSKPLLLL